MKAFLLISILLISNIRFAEGSVSFPLMLSAGKAHTCTVDLDGVKCWNGEFDVPQLNHPTQVSAGDSHSCAVDLDGVKCWGWQNEYGQIDVPQLNHPTQVSAGGGHTCAVDLDGVKCWGYNKYGQTNVPPLNHPTQVSAGGFHSCAIDADGVKCWGNNYDGETVVPPLNHPTQVSAGGFHSCAIDADGVKCWGEYYDGEVFKLNHPTQVSAGWRHACAVDLDGVKCWGVDYRGENVPLLNYPTQVSAGGRHTCALDADGVKCWMNNGDGQLWVPEEYKRWRFIFYEMRVIYFKRHRECINSIRKVIVDRWSWEDEKNMTYLSVNFFSLNLLKPLIHSSETQYILEQFLPKYNRYLKFLRTQLGYSNDEQGFYYTQDTEVTRKLAITLIESAISTALEFIAAGDQKNLQDALRASGQSLSDPMNNSKVKSLLKKLNGLDNEKQKLRRSTKSAFLADSIELAASWLQEKVK